MEIEKTVKYKVYLRRYDIAHKMNKDMLSQIAGFKIDGIWHTAIEIHETEYFYGNGIEQCEPGTCARYGPLVERTLIGETECSPDLLKEFIEDQKVEFFSKESYHLLDHNCNHFADYLSNFLVQKGIPPFILKLSEDCKKNPIFCQFYTQNAKSIHSFVNETNKK